MPFFDRLRKPSPPRGPGSSEPDLRKVYADAGVALEERRLDDALALLLQVTAVVTDQWTVWFDLGLTYKLRREWTASVAANRRAAELHDAQEIFYNLGVAATGCRDWESAMFAWHGLGLDVGPGPIPTGDFGPCPVRLDPDGLGEVVWGRRIDPCRMRIESVPLPESGHRWGDIVHHDVVPNGRRTLGGQSLPVFDELSRMEASAFPTITAEIDAPSLGDRDELGGAVTDAGFGFEDWTESIHPLCDRCSRGEVHADHERLLAPTGWVTARSIGLGGDPAVLREILDRWVAVSAERSVGAVGVATPP